MERLSRLVNTCDCYSLLVFHKGNSDTKGKLVIIKLDFRALWMLVKDLGAQVVFSSMLPIRVNSERRTEWDKRQWEETGTQEVPPEPEEELY